MGSQITVDQDLTTLLFDLDGTLYQIENGYEDHVRSNVFKFMHQKLRVPIEHTRQVWQPLFQQHNQSLKGLRAGGFKIDAEEYWDFIRAGAEQYLQPDPQVRVLLQSLPQKKWVLTNCNEKHALVALQLLNLADCFEGILGADFMGQFAKPDREVFDLTLQHIGAKPSNTAFFEDSVKNLRQAKGLGLRTILVSGATAEEEGVQPDDLKTVTDAVIDRLNEQTVRAALPELWW